LAGRNTKKSSQRKKKSAGGGLNGLTMASPIITGAISGIIVLDLDRRPEHDGMQAASLLFGFESGDGPYAETGGGGLHVLFKHPGGKVKSHTGKGAIAPGVELKGDGGFIYAPPSIHPSGKPYKWIIRPDEAEIPEAPSWLLEESQNAGKTNPPDKHSIAALLQGVPVIKISHKVRRFDFGEVMMTLKEHSKKLA